MKDTVLAQVAFMDHTHINTAEKAQFSTRQTPCPPSKCVSWPLAPVESCLVHTGDLISPRRKRY